MFLKRTTIKWVVEKVKKDEEILKKVEYELEQLEDLENGGYMTNYSRQHILQLDASRRRILEEREGTWRLKSRSFWLKAGDENTRIFQQFSRGRRAYNTIWALETFKGDRA